jgi:hypothetical protein
MRRQPRGGIELVHGDNAGNPVGKSDLREQVMKVQTMAYIQECGRLVEEQHPRRLGQAASKSHSTLLASAELFDTPVLQADEVAPLKSPFDACVVLLPLAHPPPLMGRPAHGDHLPHAETERDGACLWHNRHGAGELAAVETAHVAPQDTDMTGAGLKKARRNAEQSRLT